MLIRILVLREHRLQFLQLSRGEVSALPASSSFRAIQVDQGVIVRLLVEPVLEVGDVVVIAILLVFILAIALVQLWV